MTKEEIENDVKEFLENDGLVTIEFSVHKDKLAKTFKLLREVPHPDCIWAAYTCSTCEDYHGDGFVHVELLDLNSKFTEKDLKATNLLMTSKDLERIENVRKI